MSYDTRTNPAEIVLLVSVREDIIVSQICESYCHRRKGMDSLLDDARMNDCNHCSIGAVTKMG